MPQIILIVMLSVALVVALYFLMFGNKAAATGGESVAKLDAEAKARSKAEDELDKKRKELEANKASQGELKEELKAAKKKLFEQKESTKGDRDLVKARETVERNASIQLENVRGELAHALSELEKMRAERTPGRKPVASPTAPAVAANAPEPIQVAPVEVAPPVRVIRELSPAEKEKMERLEYDAAKARQKVAEADKEVRKLKARTDTQHRIYTVTKSELDLVKDKFRALEKRLNRTLLERDLTKRAIAALEKKTGISAERTELTAEEVADADRSVEERLAQEAQETAARVQEAAQPVPESGSGAEENSVPQSH